MKWPLFAVASLSVAGCTIISGLDDTFRSTDAGAGDGSPGADADAALTDATRPEDATISTGGDRGGPDGSASTDIFELDPTFGVSGIATFPLDPADLPSLGVLPTAIVLFGSVIVDPTSGATEPELLSAELDGGGVKVTSFGDAGHAFGGAAAQGAFYAGVSVSDPNGQDSNASLHLYTFANDAGPGLPPSSSIAEEAPRRIVTLGPNTISAIGSDSQGLNVVTFSLPSGGSHVYATEGIDGEWYGGAALATGGFALVGGCNPYFTACDDSDPGGIRQFDADGSAVGNETVLATAFATDIQTASNGQTMAVAANPRVNDSADPTGTSSVLTFLPLGASAPVNVTVTDDAGYGIAIPPFGNVRLVQNPNAAVGGFIAGWTLLGNDFSGDSAVHLTFLQANGQPSTPATLDFPVGAGVYFGALAVDSEGRVYAAIETRNSWQVLRFHYAAAH